MSKNRLKKPADDVIKIGDKEFKIPKEKKGITKKEKRDEAIKEATGVAAEIYLAWKHEMIKTPCKPHNLPGRVLAFGDLIRKKVKNKYLRGVLMPMIDDAYKKCTAVAHSFTVSQPSHPNEGTNASDLA